MNASKSIAPNSWINHSKNKNSLYYSTLFAKHASNLRNWYIVLQFQNIGLKLLQNILEFSSHAQNL